MRWPLLFSAALLLAGCNPDDPTPEPSAPPTTTAPATATPTDVPTSTPDPETTAPEGTTAVNTPTPGPGDTTPVTPTAIPTPTPIPTPTSTATEPPTASFDNDGDGFQGPDGDGADCNDAADSIYPGASEACDGIDQDCDDIIDEDIETATYYADEDGDGYGDINAPIDSCNALPGQVDNSDDCNDDDADLNPETLWYADTDNDGYGSDASSIQQCDAPMGYVMSGGDCEDDDSTVNPGASETCDGIDEDCDGQIDNDSPCYDDDGDGFCEAECIDGSAPGDCDDDDAFTYPDAPERFDWKDNNCDDAPETGRVFPIDLAHVQIGAVLQGSQFGWAIAGGGNINGDHTANDLPIDDLVIGAPYQDSTGAERGAVYIINGRERGWTGTFTLVDEMTDISRIDGALAAGHFGQAVTIVGDMNRDGLADFCAAAPNATAAQNSIANAGSAYVILGRESSFAEGNISAVKDTQVDGTGANVELGSSISGGDLDGDGMADLIIGAPDQSDNPIFQNGGWAFVLRGQRDPYPSVIGPNGVEKLRGEADNGLGMSVSYLNNFRGTGTGDFALGGLFDSDNTGFVQIVAGQSEYPGIGSTSDIEVAQYSGQTSTEELGASTAGNFDMNGDGLGDLLMGKRHREPANGETGTRDDAIAYAVFGAMGLGGDSGTAENLADVRFILPSDQDPCPCNVTGIGDMDGDGIEDIAVSAALFSPEDSGEAFSGLGRVWLFYGREIWDEAIDVEAEADAIFEGVIPNGRMGAALSSAGDLNGDGYDDLAIGAPYANLDQGEENPPEHVGRIYVQFGAARP